MLPLYHTYSIFIHYSRNNFETFNSGYMAIGMGIRCRGTSMGTSMDTSRGMSMDMNTGIYMGTGIPCRRSVQQRSRRRLNRVSVLVSAPL